MKTKPTFLPGLGEKPSDYKALSKYLHIIDVDRNTGKMTPAFRNVETLIGFSRGAVEACEYAVTHPVTTLILCSLTPGIESLAKVKAKYVIFLVGEKEKWVLQEVRRVAKTLRCPWTIHIIRKGDHRITGDYKKKLLELV